MRVVIIGQGQLGYSLSLLTRWPSVGGKKSYESGFREVIAINPDLVINCAGSTAISQNLTSARDNYLGNYRFVQTLTNICIKHKFKLLHISTNAVFKTQNAISFYRS